MKSKTTNPAAWIALCVMLIASFAGAQTEEKHGGPDQPVFWIIPHSHWEGAVFKTREEYLELGLPHILTAVRLLKEHPNYRFVLDQVEYFRPFLERYPEAAQDFKRFVAEGRLQIVGGTDVMPDDNMPSGESFVRQVLYGKGYCRAALGVDVKSGWLLDTFGHEAQLPQILKLAGYDAFWFTRGVASFKTMPIEFLWEGIDGTKLRSFWLADGYANAVFPPHDLAGYNKWINKRYASLGKFVGATASRVGFDGGDVTDPEYYVPGLVDAFNAQPDKSFTVKFATPREVEALDAGRSDLPVVRGERNPLFQGVYSTRIELKERMRTAERLLTTDEKFSALAQWLGTPPDNASLWRAWEPALFNVTHDLGSGVMTDHVYEDVNRGYDFSQRLAMEILERSLTNVLAHTDTSGPGVAVAVFNTLGSPRTEVAEAEVGFTAENIRGFKLTDARGAEVPAQLIDADHFEDGGLRQVKFAFIARDVPGMGCAIYHVTSQTEAGDAAAEEISGNVMENEFYRAEIDLKTGAVTSLKTKPDDWESLSAPANVVAEEDDHGDVWELYHTLNGGQQLIMSRPIGLPDAAKAKFSNTESTNAAVIRRGPVFSECVVRHPFGSNVFTTTLRLYQGVPRLEIETKILNNDKFVRYRLLTPTSVKDGRNFQEIQFGAIERPMSQEFPAQNWADYSDSAHGMTVLNRGLPGNNVADGTMLLSLARSTEIQEYGDEDIRSDTAFELGKELTLHYALAPHAGDWRQYQAGRAGLEFNNPLVVRKTSAHPGRLPPIWGLIEASPANVALSACKSSEDGSAIIVRVYEASGEATSAQLRFHAKVAGAEEVNLMEDIVKKTKPRNNTLECPLHPYEIKTFKVRLKEGSYE